MKTILIGAAAAALLIAPAAAQDASGRSYIQLGLGASFVTDDSATVEGIDFDGSPIVVSEELDYDTGFAFGGLFGYRVSPNFALEGEISGRANDFQGNISDEDLTVTTFMANAVLSGGAEMGVMPYAGAGIGLATSNLDDAGSAFAYQVKAGLKLPVGGGSQSVGVEAAYLATDGFGSDFIDDFGDPASFDVDYGGFSVMATYSFGFGAF